MAQVDTNSNGYKRARSLKDRAKARGIHPDQYAKSYALERFTVRACQLQKVFDCMWLDAYVKGGQLWNWCPEFQDMNRPTSDIDLHVSDMGKSKEEIHNLIKFLVNRATEIEDAEDDLEFVVGKISELIHPHNGMPGLRIQLEAYLGGKPEKGRPNGGFQIKCHLDISIGPDRPKELNDVALPTLYPGMKSAVVKVQPWSYQIAEKLHCASVKGIANGRLKDFRDLYILGINRHIYDFGNIKEAIVDTFEKRFTPIPTEFPIGLTMEFAIENQENWENAKRKNAWNNVPDDLYEVILMIREKFEGDLIDRDYVPDFLSSLRR